jgi:hypothetical protein
MINEGGEQRLALPSLGGLAALVVDVGAACCFFTSSIRARASSA